MLTTEGMGSDLGPEVYWDLAKLHMKQSGMTGDSSQAVNVGGRVAVRATMTQATPDGSAKILAYVYTARKTAFLAMCFTSPGELARHSSVFDAIAQSLDLGRP